MPVIDRHIRWVENSDIQLKNASLSPPNTNTYFVLGCLTVEYIEIPAADLEMLFNSVRFRMQTRPINICFPEDFWTESFCQVRLACSIPRTNVANGLL
jgi:hypothetical protein